MAKRGTPLQHFDAYKSGPAQLCEDLIMIYLRLKTYFGISLCVLHRKVPCGDLEISPIYYPLEVSSMKYCCLGVFRKEYFRLCTR